jgi:hypothetical protein
MSRDLMLPDGTMVPTTSRVARKLLPKSVVRRHELEELSEQVIERSFLPTAEDALAFAADEANDALRFVLAKREGSGRSMQVASILGFFNS